MMERQNKGAINRNFCFVDNTIVTERFTNVDMHEGFHRVAPKMPFLRSQCAKFTCDAMFNSLQYISA